MPGVGALAPDTVREALYLLGGDRPAGRSAAQSALRGLLVRHGQVRSVLDRAPDEARAAFVQLVRGGPAAVEELIGRGWWGRGMLPAPLDWLQRRALVVVGDDGLVHATDEARDGYLAPTLDLPEPAPAERPGLRVDAAGCVVVAASSQELDRALAVDAAGLRAVAATVAVSERRPKVVAAALRSAGVRLDDEAVVRLTEGAPALPGTAEQAVGPRAIRTLLARAVEEQRQVWLRYFASSRGGATTERVVDPWTFRDDLLRGYCHLRQGERTFALDRVGLARLLPTGPEHPQDGGLST